MGRIPSPQAGSVAQRTHAETDARGVVAAEVIVATIARAAATAWPTRLYRHEIVHRQATFGARLGAYFGDPRDDLVTEDQRSALVDAFQFSLEHVQLGTVHATPHHLQHDLAGAGPGERKL